MRALLLGGLALCVLPAAIGLLLGLSLHFATVP